MLRYLNHTRKSHFTCHILAPDGKSAICTYRPGEKTWPRVSEEWQISDSPAEHAQTCLNCHNRWQNINEPPPLRKTRHDRRVEAERDKLIRWNRNANN